MIQFASKTTSCAMEKQGRQGCLLKPRWINELSFH